jgi:hypothetical protein
MADIIQIKRGLSTAWASVNPVLAQGEFGYESDTESLKVGDGTTLWNALAYISSVAAASGTGTSLSLTNLLGYYYNMSAANSATTYTTSGTTLGAFACTLINAATEPTVTSATKIKGSDFVASTDMQMWVQYFGTTVQYFFLEL